jgi:hypothetical protein
VIHNYRWRLALAEGEAVYDGLEKRLATSPAIAVPTITLEGDANGAPHPESIGLRQEIFRPYAYREITGALGTTAAGSAAIVCSAIIDVDRL